MIGVRIIVRAIRGRATGQATSNRSSRSLPETRARRGFFVSAQGAPPPAIAGTKESHMCSILGAFDLRPGDRRSEEHTSELQSLMRISYAVFCLQKKKHQKTQTYNLKYQQKQNKILQQ